MRSVKPEHRGNWGLAFQDLTASSPSSTEYNQLLPFKEAGITDELIVHLLEQYVFEPSIDRPIPAVAAELKRVTPFEVTTVEQYVEFKAKQEAAKAKRAADMQKQRTAPAGRQQRQSNVFLKREKKDDNYYDYIFKKLDS